MSKSLLGLLGVLCASAPIRAHAVENSAQQCINDHAEGQVSRTKGALTEAREHFISCAAERCPQVIREECAGFSAEVEAAQPSVVLVAVTSTDKDASQVVVHIDGKPGDVPLDGRAVPLDPGQHQFDFRAPDGRTQSVSVMLREAEKFRRVVVRFDAEEGTASKSSSMSPLAYVFGGLGVAAGASFGYFALKGKSKESDLDGCAPRCGEDRRDEIDSMRASYLAADVSLGVAVVSLGLGAFFVFHRSEASAPSASTAHRGWDVRLSSDLARGGFQMSAATSF